MLCACSARDPPVSCALCARRNGLKPAYDGRSGRVQKPLTLAEYQETKQFVAEKMTGT